MLVNELERQRRKLMRIHAIQTGTVSIKQRQVHSAGQGIQRRLNTLLDHAWTILFTCGLIAFRAAGLFG